MDQAIDEREEIVPPPLPSGMHGTTLFDEPAMIKSGGGRGPKVTGALAPNPASIATLSVRYCPFFF